MSWKCSICGAEDEDVPLCFGMDAPWKELVPESEFEHRVELTPDLCVVDGRVFFIRGHIEIPILGYSDELSFSVWSSLSADSFVHMTARWDAFDRASDPPYFGWLCSRIPVYPNTINLKLSVQSRLPGMTPVFTTELTDHPLSVDQHNGITIARWHELAHKSLHPHA